MLTKYYRCLLEGVSKSNCRCIAWVNWIYRATRQYIESEWCLADHSRVL